MLVSTGQELTTAVFSHDRLHRYALFRQWDEKLPMIAWIGLNPSTADETKDDPTIRRIKGFSRLWGYGGIVMLNLFSFRSTDPRELYSADNPDGSPANDSTIRELCSGKRVIAAWGNHGALRGREADLLRSLSSIADVKCLGKTKAGHPVHPLYQPKSAKPILLHGKV